jgi:tryptophan halogenase
MKIVIVGGGTAGWLAAAKFCKVSNDFDITVIESAKIPIIGAGEGSTGIFPYFIKEKWFGESIDEIDFLRKTKGTIKLAITMKNWKGDGTQIYSPVAGSPTGTHPVDTAFYGAILKYNRSDFSSFDSLMLEDKLTPFKKDRTGRISAGLEQYSYHFDGVEVGKYFKEWSMARGVKRIESEVTDLEFDDNEYLKSITLTNGNKVESTLWFDCTGFAKVLMSKTKNKWISFKEHLPVNNAITFSTEITSRSVKFETLAEAMDAGWMWKIPLQQRHGCGYVYCDRFQTYEESVKEIEMKLGHPIKAQRNIKFDSGRYEKPWYNNIFTIGLSANFLEPLQATSIHITLTSLEHLSEHYLKGENINYELDSEDYNNRINAMVDDYKDFIQLHYLTGRSDTPFWKFMQNELTLTDKNKKIKEVAKKRLLTPFDMVLSYGAPGFGIWSHIIDNSGLIDRDLVEKELKHFGKYDEALQEIDKLMKHYQKIKPEMLTNEEMFKYLKA